MHRSYYFLVVLQAYQKLLLHDLEIFGRQGLAHPCASSATHASSNAPCATSRFTHAHTVSTNKVIRLNYNIAVGSIIRARSIWHLGDVGHSSTSRRRYGKGWPFCLHTCQCRLISEARSYQQQGSYTFGGLPKPYTSVSGDTLYELAAEYDLPVSTLREINSKVALPDDVNATLPSGLALSLPGQAAVPPLPTTVLVTSRTDVLALAAAYQLDTAVNCEVQGNLHIPPPCTSFPQQESLAHAGTMLRIPATIVECPDGSSPALCVRSMQTLEDVAADASSTTDALLQANPHVAQQHGHLFYGQTVWRPESQHTLPEQVLLAAWGNVYDTLAASGAVSLTPKGLRAVADANGYGSIEDLVAIMSHERVRRLPCVYISMHHLVHSGPRIAQAARRGGWQPSSNGCCGLASPPPHSVIHQGSCPCVALIQGWRRVFQSSDPANLWAEPDLSQSSIT